METAILSFRIRLRSRENIIFCNVQHGCWSREPSPSMCCFPGVGAVGRLSVLPPTGLRNAAGLRVGSCQQLCSPLSTRRVQALRLKMEIRQIFFDVFAPSPGASAQPDAQIDWLKHSNHPPTRPPV